MNGKRVARLPTPSNSITRFAPGSNPAGFFCLHRQTSTNVKMGALRDLGNLGSLGALGGLGNTRPIRAATYITTPQTYSYMLQRWSPGQPT